MYDNAWLLQHQSTCMRVDKPRQTYSERRDNPPSTPLQRPLRGSARSSKRFLKHFAYRTVESMKVYCRRGLYSNSGSTRSQTFRTILSLWFKQFAPSSVHSSKNEHPPPLSEHSSLDELDEESTCLHDGETVSSLSKSVQVPSSKCC